MLKMLPHAKMLQAEFCIVLKNMFPEDFYNSIVFYVDFFILLSVLTAFLSTEITTAEKYPQWLQNTFADCCD